MAPLLAARKTTSKKSIKLSELDNCTVTNAKRAAGAHHAGNRTFSLIHTDTVDRKIPSST
jgi:hypothetical protein